MRLLEWGDPLAPAALVAHGAGSTAEFVARVFAEPLAGAGYRLVSWQSRAGTPDEFAAAAAASAPRLVGGISLGAHVAAFFAAGRSDLDGALFVLPGWLGRPGPAAGLTAQTADELERDGVPAVLDRLRMASGGWVVDELAAGWPRHGDALPGVLRAAATSPAPTEGELAAVGVPAGVVGLRDDPMHPAAVARRWSAALPRAELRLLPRDAPATDRSVLGAAALAAWRRAVGGSR